MQQPTDAAPVSVLAAPSVRSEGAAPAAEPVAAASISPPPVDPDTAPLPPLGAAAAAQPAVVGGTPPPRERGAGSRGIDGTRTSGGRDEPRPRR